MEMETTTKKFLKYASFFESEILEVVYSLASMESLTRVEDNWVFIERKIWEPK